MTRDDSAVMSRAVGFALIGIALIFALVAVRYRPPPAQPATVSVTEFSAERAITALSHVLGDQSPHPIGSPANARVRDRIIEQLRALGYEPQIQRGFSCEYGDCGAVENILVRLPGKSSETAVMLAAHYDSVAAGPGAADDGGGVATLLEIARLLRSRPPAMHDIILLVTDGEELGLLGARVFIAEHPWAKDVRAVVNLEARGDTSASMLFETGPANARAMQLYAGRTATPITSSLYYTAYKLLPNDTDFSVFKTLGWQGYNFAFTGSVQHYHTPLDDLAHLSRNSVQHHGDNALGTLLALADADLPPPAKQGDGALDQDESVYLDVFATGVLRWPVSAALPAAGVVAIAWLLLAVQLWRQRRLRIAAAAWSTLAAVLALVVGTFGSKLLLVGLQALGALPPDQAGYQWTAEPRPVIAANVALAFMVIAAFSVFGFWLRRTDFWARWFATGLLLNAAGLASAAWLPGVSFTLLLPGLAMLLFALPAVFSSQERNHWRAVAAIAPLWMAAAVWLPILWFLYETLGLALLPLSALLVVWLLLMLSPLLTAAGSGTRMAVLTLASVTTALAALTATAQPVYTREAPQRLNFEYWFDADTKKAEWIARPDSGRLPAALKTVMPFAPRALPLLPWSRPGAWTAPAESIGVDGPMLEVLSVQPSGDGTQEFMARLSSKRGASMASVCFAPSAELSDVQMASYRLPESAKGSRAEARSRRNGGWRCVSDFTLGEAGSVELSFRLKLSEPVDLVVLDRSFGLPPAGEPLLAARPTDTVRSQDGDVTRSMRRLRLMPNGQITPRMP